MFIWEVQGYIINPNSIIMNKHTWIIKANSFEEAENIAHKRGARNIFNTKQVTEPPFEEKS